MIKGVSTRSQRVETTTGSEINGEGRSWLVNEAVAWWWCGRKRRWPSGKVWERNRGGTYLDKSRQPAGSAGITDRRRTSNLRRIRYHQQTVFPKS
jgi:hypothetical protein